LPRRTEKRLTSDFHYNVVLPWWIQFQFVVVMYFWAFENLSVCPSWSGNRFGV